MNIFFVLPEGVEEILNTLHNAGYEAYVVGGCVRDKLLDREPHDWDICTSATPDQVSEVFNGHRIIELGKNFGTVTVMMDQKGYEVTTYRVDGKYSDNRRPDSVEFTRSLLEDLSRRDFTINAMAYNEEEGLIDPFGGMRDLDNAVVRCVGNAAARFQEDALRILRALRFSIQLGFSIELITHACMVENSHLLTNISAERINMELTKMLTSGKDIAEPFKENYRVIEAIIPEMKDCFFFEQNNPYHVYDVYIHILHAVDNYKGDDLIIKLALLLHDIGKPECYTEDEKGGHFKGHGLASARKTEKILRNLRFDNDTVKSVTQLVLYHDSLIEPRHNVIKRWLNKIGEVQFRRLLIIRASDMLAQSKELFPARMDKQALLLEMLEEILVNQQCFTLKNLAVNGDDLMAIGYKPGRALGAALKGLLECVIADEVVNEKENLLLLAEAWLPKE